MPTLKAEEFCKAFYIWAEACQTELPADDEGMKQWRKDFADHWSFIALAVHKSCLLNRLIYGREPLRTEMCPVHKGRWSGCVFEKLECGCQFASNVTGWLKPSKKSKRVKQKISKRGRWGPAKATSPSVLPGNTLLKKGSETAQLVQF